MKLKGPKTQWSSFFPLCVRVCVRAFVFGCMQSMCVFDWLVGGELPFKECPAVDVFGICRPCSAIVHSPQLLPLRAVSAPQDCL